MASSCKIVANMNDVLGDRYGQTGMQQNLSAQQDQLHNQKNTFSGDLSQYSWCT